MKEKSGIKRLLAMLLAFALIAGESVTSEAAVYASQTNDDSGLVILSEDMDTAAEDITDDLLADDTDITDPDESVSENDISEGDTPDDMIAEDAVPEDIIAESTEEISADGTATEDADTAVGEETPEAAEEEPEGFSGKTADNTLWGVSMIANPITPANADQKWIGSYVYFGEYDGKPVKYRVLDNEATAFSEGSGDKTMLLDCDTILFKSAYANHSRPAWKDSNLKAMLNGNFLNSNVFTIPEREVIANSIKPVKKQGYDGTGKFERLVRGTPTYQESEFQALTGEKIFLLDACEASNPYYGYLNNHLSASSRKKDMNIVIEGKTYVVNQPWWVRSRVDDTYGYDGAVTVNGGAFVQGVFDGMTGVSPAFNIKHSDVIAATAIKGDKGTQDAEYKLTIKDDRLTAGLDGEKKVAMPVDGLLTATIPYSVSGTGIEPDTVSVMVVGTDGVILYYDSTKIVDETQKTGIISFDLPTACYSKVWGKDYKVYLLAEQRNGDRHSDYASIFEIPKDKVESSVDTHRVSFLINDSGKLGSFSVRPKDQMVKRGNKAVKPADPEASMYTFGGWYKEAECSNLFNFETAITASTELYAKWIPNETYDLWIGDTQVTQENYNNILNDADETAKYDPDTKTLTLDNPEINSGYVDGIINAMIYSKIDGLKITGEATLDAEQYGINTAIYSNGAELIFDNAELKLEGYRSAVKGKNITINGCKIEALGRNSHCINAEGSLKVIDSELSVGNYSDYACVHASEEVLIRYDNSPTVMTIENSLFGIQANKLTMDGGELYVKSTGRDCCGILVENGSMTLKGDNDVEVEAMAEPGSSNAYGIYAKNASIEIEDTFLGVGAWTENCKYAIYADKGIKFTEKTYIKTPESGRLSPDGKYITSSDGSNAKDARIKMKCRIRFIEIGKLAPGDDIPDQWIEPGMKAVEPEISRRLGERFGGWYDQETAPGYKGPYDFDEAEKFDFSKPVKQSANLFQGWIETDVFYTVEFDLNGKPGTPPYPQTVNELECASEPEAPVAEDYIFAGWYTSPACDDASRYDFTTPLTGNIKLYAGWRNTVRRVDFDLNGHKGTPPATQRIREGGRAVEPSKPADDGEYRFVGWYTDPACRMLYDFNRTVIADITLYAKWVKNSKATFRVKFDLCGVDASLVADQIIESGGKAKEPDAPIAKADEKKVFAGWYKTKEYKDGDKYDFKKTAVTGDITLYAGWTPIDDTGMFVSFCEDAGLFHDGSRYLYYYTSQKIKPAVNVTDAEGNPLTQGVDYTVKYSNNLNVDRNGKPAVVTVRGKGNYKETKKLMFYIVPKSIGNGIVSGNNLRNILGDGIEIATTADGRIIVKERSKVKPAINYGDYLLRPRDYTIRLEEGITIIGRGNFSGRIENIPVAIRTAKQIKEAGVRVSLKDVKNITYDGTVKTLSDNQLIVKDGKGSDKVEYKVRYINNKNAGTAKVVVTGIGNNTGTVTRTFKIKPDKGAEIKDEMTSVSADLVYKRSGVTPKVELTVERTVGGLKRKVKLNEGTDYKIKYSNNKKAHDKAAYTVTFTGNYKGHGKIKRNFTISKAKLDIADIEIIAPQKVYGKPGRYTSAPYVFIKDKDGKRALLDSGDYVVTSYRTADKDITKDRKYTASGASVAVAIEIKGKGNYEDSTMIKPDAYRIRTAGDGTKYDLTTAKIYAGSDGKDPGGKIPAKQYTGKAIEPAVDVYAKPVSGGAPEKVDPSQYDVTYINNVDRGKAVILVTAREGAGTTCVGSCTGSFSIGARGFDNLFQILK